MEFLRPQWPIHVYERGNVDWLQELSNQDNAKPKGHRNINVSFTKVWNATKTIDVQLITSHLWNYFLSVMNTVATFLTSAAPGILNLLKSDHNEIINNKKRGQKQHI